MISIIISSYQPDFLSNLKKNISLTIGKVEYEIIAIRNPGLMGICEAYNKGAERAQYENLLFIHEDILFHTQEWGNILIKNLKRENVGVLGVAGSNYVCKSPTGWHLSDDKYNFINIIQHNNNFNSVTIHQINHPQRVYALDGVFLAITKEKFLKIKFNENIKGFHAYDLDFSLRASQKYLNYVIHNIIIEHFSIGNPDSIWFNNNIYVRKKIRIKTCSIKDKNLEEKEFINFFNKFFIYNDFTIKNFIKTLYFIPFITSKKIIKLYYRHIRYWSYYKKHIYGKK